MDGFSGYNQIQIRKEDQYKTAFTTPWGTFSYRVMPFGLKNAGATFQRAMTYFFHDLVQILLIYLDDLTAHSRIRSDHLNDLRQVFLRCRKYQIRLNPHKCVFCVPEGDLISFDASFPITPQPFMVSCAYSVPKYPLSGTSKQKLHLMPSRNPLHKPP